MELFRTRLGSLDSSGLKDPDLRAEYVCQYSGGLIGKHFKSLAQVMPFLIFDLVNKTLLDSWITLGALVALLWHTEIADTESYLVRPRLCLFSCSRQIASGRTFTLYRGLSFSDGPMRSNHLNHQAKVPFPSPSSCLR